MADPRSPRRIEVEVEPSAAGRFTRWLERGRIARGRIEAARGRHPSVDLGFTVIERDSSIGGGLLAGALAYRLFVLLLPTALLLVSGLGLYAGAVDRSAATVAEEAGLHGLIADEVASAASGRARGVVFLVMIPTVLYATASLYLDGTGPRIGVGRLCTRRALQARGAHVAGGARISARRGRAGRLGIATALLFSLVLVGRRMIVSAELNASLVDRRDGGR